MLLLTQKLSFSTIDYHFFSRFSLKFYIDKLLIGYFISFIFSSKNDDNIIANLHNRTFVHCWHRITAEPRFRCTTQNCSFPIMKLPNQTYGNSKGLTPSALYTSVHNFIAFNATCPQGTYLSLAWSPQDTLIRRERNAMAECEKTIDDLADHLAMTISFYAFTTNIISTILTVLVRFLSMSSFFS